MPWNSNSPAGNFYKPRAPSRWPSVYRWKRQNNRRQLPNQLDSWLIIHKDGTVTVLTGKVELGTGVSTSLRQIVADELDCAFEKIIWVQGDTANTVD